MAIRVACCWLTRPASTVLISKENDTLDEKFMFLPDDCWAEAYEISLYSRRVGFCLIEDRVFRFNAQEIDGPPEEIGIVVTTGLHLHATPTIPSQNIQLPPSWRLPTIHFYEKSLTSLRIDARFTLRHIISKGQQKSLEITVFSKNLYYTTSLTSLSNKKENSFFTEISIEDESKTRSWSLIESRGTEIAIVPLYLVKGGSWKERFLVKDDSQMDTLHPALLRKSA